MDKTCANCKTKIEGVFYIDFHMTGKILCQRCSIESELEVNLESLKQTEKKLEDYELDFKPLLGGDSEEYQNLRNVALKAIFYYEDRIQELKSQLRDLH